jgi:hypothetical protein
MTVRVASVLLVSLFLIAPVVAEQKTKTPPVPERSLDAGANATPASQVPDGPALSILIRRTLLTLNDANLTGNYTVLRDVAAPGFQSSNNAAKLAEIFANLRNRDLDLAPVMYFDPHLVRPPEIGKNGMLRLSGFIPTRPQQVNFDMLFENGAGHWRLFGIAVNTSPAQSEAASLGPAIAPAAAAARKK